MDLFKRWRRSRSDQLVSRPGDRAERTDPTPAIAMAQPSAASADQPVSSSKRARRPATMGRTAAEQAYLAQAATRAKQD